MISSTMQNWIALLASLLLGWIFVVKPVLRRLLFLRATQLLKNGRVKDAMRFRLLAQDFTLKRIFFS